MYIPRCDLVISWAESGKGTAKSRRIGPGSRHWMVVHLLHGLGDRLVALVPARLVRDQLGKAPAHLGDDEALDLVHRGEAHRRLEQIAGVAQVRRADDALHG